MVSVETRDTIYPNPKNVGIIINEGNASTAEQFLLSASQSKKVKLFGTTTAGVLDVSNMHFVDSPCKDLQLGYGLTITMRIPEMAVDDIGIQPDFYIDKSIPDYYWIDFVESILDRQK
jgi:C-terminal processing protease CtpA/Prc